MSNQRQCFQCFAAPSCSWRQSSRLMMGPRRFHRWWHSAFVLCAYGLVSASCESEYCHTWEPSTWPVEGWLRSGIHSYCNWTGQHESKLFTSFVQASRNLQIDGMIIMEGKIHSERCLAPVPRQKHPNSTQIILVQARTSSSQENEQACVRSHASRNALLSPRCSLTCSSAVPLRSRCRTKIIPRASLECRTWQHIDWVHENGPLRRRAAFLLYICQTWSVPETKNKLFPGLRLKPWILRRQFDPSWTSRDGPQRLGRALRVSNVAVQNASEKFHRSTGWLFQFCLFIILPSSESNWLVVSHIGRLVVSQITRPSSDFGSCHAPWVDVSQVQWAPCSAAAFAIEIEGGMLVSLKYPVLKCYLECYLKTQDCPSVCVRAQNSFICAVLSPARKQRCHTGRNHICTATGDKGGQLVPGACGIVGKNLQSEISCPKGTRGPSRTPWKSWGLEVLQQLFTWCRASCVSSSRAGWVWSWVSAGEGRPGISHGFPSIFHITLFARNAQNNAMGLFRPCNPGIQKSLVSWYVLGFENIWT